MAKPRIALPVIVEGKYDKITLLSYFDADVFVTGGFSIFNAKEKQALFRRIAGEKGVILLTDPDGGGKQIRSFLLGILPKEKVYCAVVPKIRGKERRKDAPSKAGLLGVEGMNGEILRETFSPFLAGESDAPILEKERKKITKVDFFEDHLTGCPSAAANRARLAKHFSMPDDMTANALLEALNLLIGYDGYRKAVDELFPLGAREDG